MSSPSLCDSMFKARLDMTNILAVSYLNPLGSTSIALSVSLKVGSHWFLPHYMLHQASQGKEARHSQGFCGASFRFPQQIFRSLFSLPSMCNHFDDVFLDFYSPCLPYLVFTITWSSYKARAEGIPMEPSVRDLWNNRSHEATVLQQLMAKLQELEGMLVELSNWMEERFISLKVGLSSLARRMDDMEVIVQQIRDPGPAQRSTSDSVNLGRNPPNDGDWKQPRNLW
jgi:hypothetical protein